MNIVQNFTGDVSLFTESFTSSGLGVLIPVSDKLEPTNEVITVLFDSNLKTYSADSFNNYQCSPRNGVTVVNLNPEVATLNSQLKLVRIADGVGKVRFSRNGTKTERSYNTTISSTENYPIFVSYVDGSVSKTLESNVLALVNSDTNKKDKTYYSTINHATATYARNPNCWARNVDLSCLSVGSTSGTRWANERPGVLVTHRHVSIANHYGPVVGEKLRFLTPAGVVRELTVIGASGVYYDRRVLTLSDVATGCSIAKIPGEWIYQTSGNQIYFGGLLLNTNKYKECGVCIFGQPDNSQSYNAGNLASYGSYIFSDLAGCLITWWKHPWLEADLYGPQSYIAFVGGGSSGHPVFAIVDSAPVLMMQYVTPSGGLGAWSGNANDNLMDVQIAEADADAVARGNLVSLTGLTATVATNPTL